MRGILDFLEDWWPYLVSGIVGSFIGIGIAYLLGIM